MIGQKLAPPAPFLTAKAVAIATGTNSINPMENLKLLFIIDLSS
jgi:hypothetical protein